MVDGQAIMATEARATAAFEEYPERFAAPRELYIRDAPDFRTSCRGMHRGYSPGCRPWRLAIVGGLAECSRSSAPLGEFSR